MPKPKLNSSELQAAALSIPERQLLFCIASKADWEKVGITPTIVMTMVARGLIQRDGAGELQFTKEGQAVLAALLGRQ
jgi:hypothetical protein